MTTQEQVVELAELLADHRPDKWPWGCDCGEMATATERSHSREHRRHLAEVIVAAGYERRRDVRDAVALRKQVEG